MNVPATVPESDVMESVIAKGDLAKLTPDVFWWTSTWFQYVVRMPNIGFPVPLDGHLGLTKPISKVASL